MSILKKFLFVILVLPFIICSCNNERSNSAQVYVPSQELLHAIEGGDEVLKVCKSVEDSFYVGLVGVKGSMVKLDTLRSVEDLNAIEPLSERVESLNLLSDFYLQKFETEKSDIVRDSILRLGLSKLEMIGEPVLEAQDFYLAYCNRNMFNTNVDITSYLEKLETIISVDSSHTTAEIDFMWAAQLRSNMLFEEAVTKGLKAISYFETDSLYVVEHGRVLSLISGIFYDMEEFDECEKYYHLASTHFRENVNDQTHLAKLMFTKALLEINVGEKDAVLQVIENYKSEFNSTLSRFRYNFLMAVFHYAHFEDLAASQFYQEAIKISVDHSKLISKKEWLDVRVQAIIPLDYLGRYSEAYEILKEIRGKYPDLDSISIFDNFILVQAKMRELTIETKLAIENKSDIKLKFALENIELFLDQLELNNLRRRPENVYHIYNNFADIYDLKFKLMLALYEINPSATYDTKLFYEVEKLKAKEQFLRKAAKTDIAYERLLNLIQAELEYKQLNVEDFRYQKVVDSIQIEFPQYWDVFHQDDEHFLKNAMNLCEKRNVQIIEYYIGSWAFTIGFLVSENGIRMQTLQDVRGNYDSIDLYGGTLDADSLQQFNQINKSVYNAIYQPFESFVNKDRLIFISDGLVDNVSFDSFIIEGEFLMKRKSIGYAYSIKSLMMGKANNKIDFKNQSIIAYSYTDSKTIKKNEKHEFNELIGGYTECIGLKKSFPHQVKVVTGKSATKDHFLNNALSHDIVHLALHGSGERNSIRNNKLFFRSDSQDEYLMPQDIFEIKNIKTKLLVLNACETNNARGIINEGNFSMAKHFSNMGIDFILTSSWPIHDTSSQEIISLFYENLADSNDPILALSDTKKEFVLKYNGSKRAHPFYWSALKIYIS